MNIFAFRRQVIENYAAYTRSFIQIREPRLHDFVAEQLRAGVLWPEPLIQANPSFEPGASIDELVAEGVLHAECGRVFRIKPDPQSTDWDRAKKRASCEHLKRANPVDLMALLLCSSCLLRSAVLSLFPSLSGSFSSG